MTYQNSKEKTLSLRNLLTIPIFIYLVAIIMGAFYLCFKSSPIFDAITVIISLGIGLLILFAVQFSRKYLFDQMAVIGSFFILYILLRIVTYLFCPAIVIWPFGNGINAGTVNAGLFYIFVGAMLFMIGMKIADMVFYPYRSLLPPVSVGSSCYSTKVPVTLFLIVATLQAFVMVIMEISPYGAMQVAAFNALFQFVRTIFELDSAFFFVFATLLYKKIVSGKNNLTALIIVVLIYIFLTGLGGSRVGALRVLIFLVLTLIVIGSNLRFRIKKLCMIVLMLGVAGLVIFPFATLSRVTTSTGSFEHAVDETKNLRALGNVISSALNRLGWVLDYPVLIVTQEGDTEAKEKYMNLLYPTKNIINMLVPGNPFPEAMIMTSRVVDVIYRGGSEPAMYSGYCSEFWTIWGLMYVYFGWLGGLLTILFAGFIIHALYVLIVIHSSGLHQFYLRLWFLLYVTRGLITNMGFDSAFITLFQGLLQFITLYFCLSIIQFLYGLGGRFLKQTVSLKMPDNRSYISDQKLSET